MASIQFDGNNNPMAVPDGNTFLNKSVQNPSAMSDGQKASIGIAVNQSKYASFNTGSGPATQGSTYESVQLRAPDGKVQIGAYRTDEATVANLQVMAPDMFKAPEVRQAEAAAAADAARSEEITREDLNRHPDDQIEAAHQHFVGEVSTQNQVSLLVYAHRGEAPPADLLNRIASEMSVPLHEAIDKVNAISMATQAQFTVLARSMNLDADRAADWIKEHRKDTAMAAAQAHGLRRDLLAWKPLLEDYRRATGDGVKH